MADGRTLAYAEWGDPRGDPVLLFHGSGGSRLFRPDEAITRACGVRLITVDRPGFGRSDPLPGRTLLGWPQDVAGLAHELAIGSFGVVGYSSGGPHALACGAVLAHRVTALAVAGCPAPPDALPGGAGRLAMLIASSWTLSTATLRRRSRRTASGWRPWWRTRPQCWTGRCPSPTGGSGTIRRSCGCGGSRSGSLPARAWSAGHGRRPPSTGPGCSGWRTCACRSACGTVAGTLSFPWNTPGISPITCRTAS